MLLGFAATGLHAVLLHRWIDISAGQNLTFFNMISLVAWLNALLIFVLALRKPTESLCIVASPIAILSITLVLLFPHTYLINTAEHPKQLVHIILSVFTFSVICLAALQAILLAIQEWLLRHPKNQGFLQLLPPLENMETLLFQMVTFGFALLSTVLITSLLFFDNIFSSELWQKTLLSLLTWLLFAVLLLGRYYFGWRGRTAINCTLIGAVLLMLAFFGGRLLIGLLMN